MSPLQMTILVLFAAQVAASYLLGAQSAVGPGVLLGAGIVNAVAGALLVVLPSILTAKPGTPIVPPPVTPPPLLPQG